MNPDELEIWRTLEEWSKATKEGRLTDVLANHADEAMIFDVLPPFQYASKADYQASWAEWQPDVQAESIFHLENLQIIAGTEVGFAYARLQCGGIFPNGKTFRDTVRATFCLKKESGHWIIYHQHISKPLGA